jgi:hypothetical protein
VRRTLSTIFYRNFPWRFDRAVTTRRSGTFLRTMTLKSPIAKILTLAFTLTSLAENANALSLCAHWVKPGALASADSQTKTSQTKTGLSKTEYDSVLSKIDRLYRDEFKALGGTLAIHSYWESNSIDARALELGWMWSITMYGGLARHPLMTKDAFTLVACHEIGHHLGGAPNKILSPLASEGAADYYATLKCSRRFFADEDNLSALKKTGVNKYLASECRKEFSNAKDAAICMRSGMAGMQLAKALQAVNGDTTPIHFQTPDQKFPLLFSRQAHPRAQCRLDTFLNGARCPVPVTERLSESSYWPGTCDRENEPANTGSRPRCWFKP